METKDILRVLEENPDINLSEIMGFAAKRMGPHEVVVTLIEATGSEWERIPDTFNSYREKYLGHKECSRCTGFKATTEFHKDKKSKGGFRAECKDCYRARRVEKEEAEKEDDALKALAEEMTKMGVKYEG